MSALQGLSRLQSPTICHQQAAPRCTSSWQASNQPVVHSCRTPAASWLASATEAQPLRQVQCCRAYSNGQASTSTPAITEADLGYLTAAAKIADSSAGLVSPHPNFGCVLISADGLQLACTFQRAQGATSAEVQAIQQAGPAARGATAYLNLETGDCHGDDTALRALLAAGVAKVVVGLLHPLKHLRGGATAALRAAGVQVYVLGQSPCLAGAAAQQEALHACLLVNEALIHRAATGRPFSILKYAMTADGKIATTAGHAAWVSCAESRARVFAARARSDAVIVGGNTVRRDNPRLTTRAETGHTPVRIVMSRTLDLPEDANLWDVTLAPTIVMTQRGVRRGFQEQLRAKGVEVVQFDFLTPDAVAHYCSARGFLQCLWECGGTLAAPAIASQTVHKAMAFIAPKLIGGVRAPSPVGDLGNQEMTQALPLAESSWAASGSDMLLEGYLPASGGLAALAEQLASGSERPLAAPRWDPLTGSSGSNPEHSRIRPAVEFYKTWNEWGALANFSPHPIRMAEGPGDRASPASSSSQPQHTGQHRLWPTVEHYYQAQKFAGVSHPDAYALIEEVASAPSPEEAARLGRGAQATRPHLLRPDWDTAKLFIMEAALRVKFDTHAAPRAMLLASAGDQALQGLAAQATLPADVVEAAPHDFFWGRGVDGSGSNHLGALLVRLRTQLLSGAQAAAVQPAAAERPLEIHSFVTDSMPAGC